MRPAALLAAGLALVAVLPVLAALTDQTVSDQKDTKGLLDVRRVEVVGGEKPRWKVFTFARWRARDIRDRGFVLVFLDTFGGERPDYYAFVRLKGTSLAANLYRDRAHKRDYRMRRVRVWRAGRRNVSVLVPLRAMKIDERRLTYSWYVQTLFTSNRCRRVCFDLVPNRGAIERPLPGVPPSPMPTTVPSPTPTIVPGPTPTST